MKAIWDRVAAWEVWWDNSADLDMVELSHRGNNWKQLEAILLMPRKDWIEDYGFWNVEEELHD